uniref:Uncharacterized protein n=1 Tax=Rhizophora mucronata TaxID=61149 RepID=A0A2P2R124_RHIMU
MDGLLLLLSENFSIFNLLTSSVW